ncbi:kynurenine 3-monooxygenase [Cryptococcus neoformans Bt1]|nr:kynurenine 3-monooxygenase [Cryptococcus neoformans var. grubii Bt1]OXG33178.1 kynurenine 3-monooxygenase [Cryptococcus neoformans var. grubii Ze90-1]
MTSVSLARHVLIVGGGIGGPSLAIALARRNIRSTIYEIRPFASNEGGALIISPNALCVLDKILGMKDEVLNAGYQYDNINIYSSDGQWLGAMVNGDKDNWGYRAVRVTRTALHNRLLDQCHAMGGLVNIEYGKVCEKVEEGEHSVKVYFADGTHGEGDILIGADGIYSKVREQLLGPTSPSPFYEGLVGLWATTPCSAINIPPSMTLPAAIYTPPGLLLLFPIDPSGETIGWIAQRSSPERSKEGWKVYETSGDCVRATKADYEGIDYEPAKSLIASLEDGQGKVWPPYSIPDIPTWHSKRICLIGDAAHAIPPSAGQGASQAIEDAGLLARLLTHEPAVEKGYESLFEYFEKTRRMRFQSIRSLTRQSSASRFELKGPVGWWFRKWSIWMFLRVLGSKGYYRDAKLMGYDITQEKIDF